MGVMGVTGDVGNAFLPYCHQAELLALVKFQERRQPLVSVVGFIACNRQHRVHPVVSKVLIGKKEPQAIGEETIDRLAFFFALTNKLEGLIQRGG
ncbi:hypothetical protein ES703_37658 [subsurface metagenome]